MKRIPKNDLILIGMFSRVAEQKKLISTEYQLTVTVKNCHDSLPSIKRKTKYWQTKLSKREFESKKNPVHFVEPDFISPQVVTWHI